MQLSGRRAVITGAAGGVGAAVAHLFAAEDARVTIADVNAPAARDVADAISATGAEAFAFGLDVTDPQSWAALVGVLDERWGGFDILVNNAAIASGLVRIEDRSPEDWDRTMAVNARGPFLGTRAALPVFRRQGGGVIVNVSSLAGLGQSAIMDTAYACSKAALTMLTRITAAQHGGEGVRCNSVHPGPIDSELARAAYALPGALAHRLSRIPAGRLARMDEVASAILFLASDASSYINGAALTVDGGGLVQ